MSTANKKTACVLFYTDNRYDGLASNVRRSFIKWNGEEADFYQIDYTNQEKYNSELKYYDFAPETFIMQYIYAYEIMRKHGYSKVIILGSDTIVCSRLDEFLDDDTTPVLATLNYYIHEETEYWKSPIVQVLDSSGRPTIEHLNVNADVVCFNSHEALKKVIDLSIEHYGYFSIQGGLNELAWAEKSFEVKVVDFPYDTGNVSYNVRAKGVPRAEMISEGKVVNCWPNNIHGFPYEWLAERQLLDGNPSPIHRWYVKDGRLFTHDHKQIKCFHFVEGLGAQKHEKFWKLINDFKTTWFNKETLEYFRNECDCSEFFNK
jgi:hypothetical protein